MADAAGSPAAVDAESTECDGVKFWDWVRLLRENQGLTQQEVAQRVGVSPAMLSHVEAGRRQASERLLPKLAEVLGQNEQALARLQALTQYNERFAREGNFLSWVAATANSPGGGDLIIGASSGEPDVRLECEGGPASVAEAKTTGAGSLLETVYLSQLKELLGNGAQTDGRMDRVVEIVRALAGLKQDELLRVAGFVEGVRAARSTDTAVMHVL